MDVVPPKRLVNKVRQLASQNSKVLKIDKCFVRKMGFDYFVDIQIQVDGSLTVTEGHAIAHAVKDKLLAGNFRIKDVFVHIELFGE